MFTVQDTSEPNKRFLVNRTVFNDKIVIVNQRDCDDKWMTSDKICIPLQVLLSISRNYENELQKQQQQSSPSCDSDIYFKELPDHTSLSTEDREMLYNIDLDNISLWENQEGYWRDVDAVDFHWGVSNDLVTTTPEYKPLRKLKTTTPPPSDCLAPFKKRKAETASK